MRGANNSVVPKASLGKHSKITPESLGRAISAIKAGEVGAETDGEADRPWGSGHWSQLSAEAMNNTGMK